MSESWNERTGMLVGETGLQRLKDASVVVAGIGGVGGYAAEMLVRAGVGHLTVIDSDTVSETNRNRQILALVSTLGRSKCSVIRSRLLDINPDLDLTVIETYIQASIMKDGTPCNQDSDSTPAALLDGRKVDFLVDAIDTLAPKMSLIKYCTDRGIPLVSSMGAGAKLDATKVRIADISKTYNCPLAFVVRKRLRRIGIKKGFKAVFSEELPDYGAIVECDDLNKKSQTGTISYLPAVFGCVCAQAAIQHLLSD